VDFVERGFNRFCRQNGAVEAKRVWVGDLRIADTLFELTEQERNQIEAGRDESTPRLFLIADYEAAASIPIGATLARLEVEHHLLAAAFYRVSPSICTSGCACTSMSTPRNMPRRGWRI